MARAQCRLSRAHGTIPSILLYVLFFLPTSINAAWLSIASGLGVLIVPLSYGHTAHLEAAAAVTAAVATAAGNCATHARTGMSILSKTYQCFLLAVTTVLALWHRMNAMCQFT